MVHVLNAAASITNFGFHWSEKKKSGFNKNEARNFSPRDPKFFLLGQERQKNKNKNKTKQNRQNKTNLELFLLIQFQRRHIPIVLLLS